MKVSVLLDSSPWISDYSPHLSHPVGENHCQLKYFDLCCLGSLGRNALSSEGLCCGILMSSGKKQKNLF